MKSISLLLAIYFFIGSLIPRMDFSQLLHLPDVIEHYQLHHTESHAVGEHFNFWDFIHDNTFAPNDHIHDHPGDHENQPCFSLHSSVLVFIIPTATTVRQFLVQQKSKEVSYQNDFYLTGFLRSLIQPPNC